MIRRKCSEKYRKETHIKFRVSLGQLPLDTEKEVGRYRKDNIFWKRTLEGGNGTKAVGEVSMTFLTQSGVKYLSQSREILA